VIAAQDDDREAFTRPIRRGAKAPPDANGIAHDGVEAGLQQLLHHHRGGIGFPDAALGQHGKSLAHRLSGQAELPGDLQSDRHGSIL
jgi:hypothetical protein